nr:hypothetical protein 2 - Halobacterium sp. plasmid pHSB [Halobacterium sp.]
MPSSHVTAFTARLVSNVSSSRSSIPSRFAIGTCEALRPSFSGPARLLKGCREPPEFAGRSADSPSFVGVLLTTATPPHTITAPRRGAARTPPRTPHPPPRSGERRVCGAHGLSQGEDQPAVTGSVKLIVTDAEGGGTEPGHSSFPVWSSQRPHSVVPPAFSGALSHVA